MDINKTKYGNIRKYYKPNELTMKIDAIFVLNQMIWKSLESKKYLTKRVGSQRIWQRNLEPLRSTLVEFTEGMLASLFPGFKR